MKRQIKKFLIDHIDPLGQGVYKENDQVYFIPKTLPTETGNFEILQSKKGVNFGRLLDLEVKASNRIEPTCPHFNHCPGCHFLHTDYDSEVSFKEKSYRRLLDSVNYTGKIQIQKSKQRTGYRNRIQLHYNLKNKSIGFFDAKAKRIITPNSCIIAVPEVKQAMQNLLENNQWLKIAKKYKKAQGHVEIYFLNNQIQITWNKKYAEGGFTQVNESTNNQFKSSLSQMISDPKNVLDLFAGAGNLSNQLQFESRKCIDIYDNTKISAEFYSLNLFDENALDIFSTSSPTKDFDTFIIDPPRSGFKNIAQWTQFFQPDQIIYVSCGPQTMLRDIKTITEKYKIKEAILMDFFASTFHYEACLILEKIR
jgi:23S rRNA (uracil1939-C5)-methyltransferase